MSKRILMVLTSHDRLGDTGEPTGFTNEEEDAVGLTNVVPHLVENALIAGGAHYSKADVFAPYTRQDGLLITGQNPPSSEPVAQLLLKALEK